MKRTLNYSLIHTISLIVLFMSVTACNESPTRKNIDFFSDKTTTSTNTDNSITPEEDELEQRPSNVVFLQAGVCACQNKEVISLSDGSCASTCSSQVGTDLELFIKVQLDELITADDRYQNLRGWCQNLINDGTEEGIQANCIVDILDEDNNAPPVNLVDASLDSLTVRVNATTLTKNKTYRVTLRETSSQATSTTTQFRLIDPAAVDNLGILKLSPVTRYTCFTRIVETDNQFDYFNDAFRLHFYFIERDRPNPIPSGVDNLFCHDIFRYGVNDSNVFPRIEETPKTFTLWDKEDPRLYDLDGDNQLDVHNHIQSRVSQLGGSLNSTPTIFEPFSWPGDPFATSQAGNSVNVSLGFYMTTWLDENFRSYCPKESHYYSDNLLFKALRDYVQIDTEGLYIAEKQIENIVVDENGNQVDGTTDIILIRESVLKSIWFYLDSNQNHIQADENSVSQEKVMFYWPADPNSPLTRKSHQRTYVLKRLSEVGTGTVSEPVNDAGVRQSFPTHDKKFGCVPVLE